MYIDVINFKAIMEKDRYLEMKRNWKKLKSPTGYEHLCFNLLRGRDSQTCFPVEGQKAARSLRKLYMGEENRVINYLTAQERSSFIQQLWFVN